MKKEIIIAMFNDRKIRENRLMDINLNIYTRPVC